ncbi:hypothetical protein EDM59_01645 [Brevibacillus nitrificans]|uniref:Uncharacterized protein n=1 Tax=Brevibacillus nitrificans TaxID=651560 RepID=A0A3M8DPW9_9BACL|nr:hypothetical protein [Brevibacillus nitrificans]RNB90178.1 hypothetical protein EDM59_01645 [Brevibacillus nitrificans]
MEFKIFGVGEDYTTYVVSQTKEEALELCNSLVREEDQTPIEEVSEVSFESSGRFETESGYQEMTFGEFLGKDFVYENPTIICWNE